MTTAGTPTLGGLGAINGTMPAWSKTAERWPPVDFVDYCLRGVGQVVFMNNPITGLAILVAMYIASAWLGVAGTIGLVVSTVTALILGMDRGAIRAGLYGFNGVLVGAALAIFLRDEWDAAGSGYIVAISAFSTVLMGALSKVFLSAWAVPPFTLPFNFATLIFLIAALNFGRVDLGTLIGPQAPAVAGDSVLTGLRETPDGPSVVDASSVLNAVFRGIGQLFFADNLASGVIIIAGILVASRIAAVFALIGSIVGMLTGLAVGASGFAIYHGLWGFNSFDAALAIGGVFYVLTWRSGLFAVACAIVTALFFGAIGSLFTPWGLPALTLPFCFGTLVFVLLKGMTARLIPVAVEDITTPEEHLRLPQRKGAAEPGQEC